ncbi:hypothetical protein WJX81_003682 [Elliptochloris bilobata]|uniref:Uncharacterized protein n=1 Tax=Elliptochloris bilobata TaxID=381761 RepID=A0AAW1QU03_9CHLO
MLQSVGASGRIRRARKVRRLLRAATSDAPGGLRAGPPGAAGHGVGENPSYSPKESCAVRHTFRVTVETASGLPAGGAGAKARFIRYLFPGEEEALYTRDAPVGAAAAFGASACHSIALLPGEELPSALAPGAGGIADSLCFELFERRACAVETLGACTSDSDVRLDDSGSGAEREPLREPRAVEAVVCVELLRACGLASGVREAAAWLGGGAGKLGKAATAGPRTYARLALFPRDPGKHPMQGPAAPALRTPLQPPGFCPDFGSRRELPLVLDARCVRALATRELALEVWHACARPSPGRSAEGASPDASEDVFLGGASAPLAPLLARPQGLRAWLVLRSRRGQPAGAVQVAVYLTSLDGLPWPSSPAGCSPLERAGFRVVLRHCDEHWVLADAALASALRSLPLVVTLLRQEAPRERACMPALEGSGPQPVVLGSADIDLAPLLHVRPGARQAGGRWVGGTYPLIHPDAADLGGALVRVKVTLELDPDAAPPPLPGADDWQPQESPAPGPDPASPLHANGSLQAMRAGSDASGSKRAGAGTTSGVKGTTSEASSMLQDLDGMAARFQAALSPAPPDPNPATRAEP